MKTPTLLLLLLICSVLVAQTVYFRDSAPAAVPVCGASNTTPIVIQTCSAHGLNVGDTVSGWGIVTGTDLSTANGPHKVLSTAYDSTHVALGDVATLAPLPANGAWADGTGIGSLNSIGGAQWIGKVNPYTLGTQPLGWLDGLNGPRMHKFATGPLNGLTTISVTSNVASVTLSYNHGMSNGDKVAIWGSGNSSLDNSHNPYTITVTGAQTYTFPTASVSNGTKTGVNFACGPPVTPNDTIGVTQDCIRTSQIAYVGNAWWDGIVSALAITHMNSDPDYKFVFHGGLVTAGFQSPGFYANAALFFVIDQSNAQMFKAAMYAFNNFEFTASVNWIGNETFVNAGNTDTNDFLSHYQNGLAMVYAAVSKYASTAHKTTLINKIYNDKDTACSTANGDVATGHNDIITSGTAQGGSSNTIILAASDGAADNFYNNNVVLGSFGQQAVISGYVASTKVATISGSWAAPTSTDTYIIYSSVTVANSAAGATTAMLGYNTHFTTRLAVGDAVEGRNFWDETPDSSAAYVSAITDDTHATVINSWQPVTSASVPAKVWYFRKWAPGDCGMMHRNKYWSGSPGSQPIAYPGGGTNVPAAPGTAGLRTLATDGGNNTATWAASHLTLGLLMCADDARACNDLMLAQNFGFDYEVRHGMNYGEPMHSGGAYELANTTRGMYQFAEQLALSVPTFPDMDLAGPWATQASLMKMYFVYPDLYGGFNNGTIEMLRRDTDTDNGTGSYGARTLIISGATIDPIFTWSPASASAGFYRNFLERAAGFSMWGFNGVAADLSYIALLHNSPSIPSVDYRTQPPQRVFMTNSATRCAALTGWPCDPLFRGDSMVSRTDWTTTTATVVYYGSKAWWGDHSSPENGTIRIYKGGPLVNTDFIPTGGGISAAPNQTAIGDMVLFGTTQTTKGGIFGQTAPVGGTSSAGITPIKRWASQYAGSLGAAYGDQNGKYAYVCSDLSGAYTTPMAHFTRCAVDFKKSSNDQFVLDHTDIDVTGNPIALESHVHYVQNLQPADGQFTDHTEGDTTCPGGCNNLNSGRAVVSLQDGGTNGVTARIYGVVTNFLSPGTITLRDDAAANTVNITAVRKTATFSISSFITGVGFITTINTSAPHGLLNGEIVKFNSITGSGCAGNTAFNNGIYTWPVTLTGANSFTITLDTRSGCTSPSGGTVTSVNMFTATGHGLVSTAHVRIVGATGDWAPWNTNSMVVEVVDADHFNQEWISSPDTSGYTTSFNGVMSHFYPGGNGNTHRVTIAAGGTIGAAVNGMEYLTIHKIVNGLTDTALTTTALNPDANWTGAQMCGARSCAVYLGARHGVTQSTMAGFMTTHSGTAQYLIGGITAGSGYAITINGTPVTGSPFTVAAGDNSIEFESTAGTVSLNGGSPVCGITTSSLPGGTVGIGYSQTVSVSNCTAPIAWTVSAGTLCAGLSLGSSTGVISGTPTTAQTCSFTVQGVDALPTTTSQALSIVIAGGSAGRAPVVGGRAGASGKIIVH